MKLLKALDQQAQLLGYKSLRDYICWRYWVKGSTLQDIAEALGTYPMQVMRVMDQLEINRRPKGRKQNLEGATIEGPLRSVSQQLGIPASTLHSRRKRLKELSIGDAEAASEKLLLPLEGTSAKP